MTIRLMTSELEALGEAVDKAFGPGAHSDKAVIREAMQMFEDELAFARADAVRTGNRTLHAPRRIALDKVCETILAC